MARGEPSCGARVRCIPAQGLQTARGDCPGHDERPLARGQLQEAGHQFTEVFVLQLPRQSQAPETSGKVIDGEMTGSAAEGRAVEVVHLGFGKAFDAASRNIPLDLLMKYKLG